MIMRDKFDIDEKYEAQRLNELYKYQIIDTPEEKKFDHITQMAATIFEVKYSLISLVDNQRQWFKSCYGIDIKQTEREISFCTHAIRQDNVFEITNTLEDERFKHNPLVTSAPHLRFYAGAPLISPAGYRLGTLCILDDKPNSLSESQKQILQTLAKNVFAFFDFDLKNRQLLNLANESRAIQLISKTGGWSLDVASNVVTWSDGIYHIYQIPVGTPIVKIDAISYYAPHERERISNYIMSAVSEGQPYADDFEFIDAKGNHKWVRAIGRPIANAQGDVIKVIGTFQDITEKKLHEKKLSENEKLYRKMFEFSLDPMTTLQGPDWRFHSGNSAAIRLFELSTEKELATMTPATLSPKYQEDGQLSSEKAIQMIQIACERGHHSFEWIHLKKGGEQIFCQVNLQKLSLGGKEFIQTTIRDLTEVRRRDRIEQVISLLHAKYIQFKNNRHDFYEFLLEIVLKMTQSDYGFVGQILVDNDGKYLKLHSLTDISWDENTKNIFDNRLVHGIEFRNLKTLFGEVVTTGKYLISNDPKTHPARGGFPIGHPSINNFMGIPLYHADKFLGMIGVANRDGGYNDKLYYDLMLLFEVIAEIFHSLILDEELDLQKKYAIHNAKLASVGELAAGVGHEINNPLAIVTGQLVLLEKLLEQANPDFQEIKNRIEKSYKGLDRIKNIVKGLRNFARADDEPFVTSDLNQVILDLIDLIREIYIQDGIELTLNLSQYPLMVNINRGQIQQVILNLISNAKDALTNMECKKIVLTTRRVAENASFSIADNGPGVPAYLQTKIFDPFFTTKGVNVGTGIGLSIASSIILAHAGRLSLKTDVKQGATFEIVLPLSLENEITSDVENHTTENHTTQISAKVLIVDDESDLRDVLQMMLSELGLEITLAAGGVEALRLYQKSPNYFDLIISDFQMPTMDGASLFAAIKEIPTLKKPKFIFMTGGVQNLDEKSDIPKEVDGILYKPFGQNEIENLIKKLI